VHYSYIFEGTLQYAIMNRKAFILFKIVILLCKFVRNPHINSNFMLIYLLRKELLTIDRSYQMKLWGERVWGRCPPFEY